MPAAPQEQIAPNAFEYVVAIGSVKKNQPHITHMPKDKPFQQPASGLAGDYVGPPYESGGRAAARR
jgi:hypothetical protein